MTSPEPEIGCVIPSKGYVLHVVDPSVPLDGEDRLLLADQAGDYDDGEGWG